VDPVPLTRARTDPVREELPRRAFADPYPGHRRCTLPGAYGTPRPYRRVRDTMPSWHTVGIALGRGWQATPSPGCRPVAILTYEYAVELPTTNDLGTSAARNCRRRLSRRRYISSRGGSMRLWLLGGRGSTPAPVPAPTRSRMCRASTSPRRFTGGVPLTRAALRCVRAEPMGLSAARGGRRILSEPRVARVLLDDPLVIRQPGRHEGADRLDVLSERGGFGERAAHAAAMIVTSPCCEYDAPRRHAMVLRDGSPRPAPRRVRHWRASRSPSTSARLDRPTGCAGSIESFGASAVAATRQRRAVCRLCLGDSTTRPTRRNRCSTAGRH
jgi:hypothetical protein